MRLQLLQRVEQALVALVQDVVVRQLHSFKGVRNARQEVAWCVEHSSAEVHGTLPSCGVFQVTDYWCLPKVTSKF